MTKFTIILLCRNRPEYTEFALKSILRQKIKDYYVVLSDNSSTDNCAEKNRSSYEKYGNLFNGIYIRQSGDLTMCAHLTKILSQYSQSSDYIAIHNDDDIWLSSHLASAAIALDQGYSVFVGNAAEIDVNGKIISKYLSAPN